MVHVLSNLLHTVHQSLRSDGLLMLFQPDAAYKVVELTVAELTVDESVLLKEEIEESNFMEYLLATHTVIQEVQSAGLFVKEKEMTVPVDGTYNYHDFGTIDMWEKDYGWLTDDPDALMVFADRMRKLANGREHHVRSYSRDYEVLLRKVI